VTTNHTPVAHASSGGPELLIRPETSDDHQAVRELHLAAFADDKSVAALVDVLREASAPLAPLLFVEGSPGYYGNRGFERADKVGFRPPSLRIPAAAFQVARLSAYEPWMTGTLVYSESFWALVCAARSFRPRSRHAAGRQPEPHRCERAG